MNVAQIIFQNLPYRAKGFIFKNQDDTCTIILNARHTCEQNKKSFQHELEHLNDFKNEVDVSFLEHERRNCGKIF